MNRFILYTIFFHLLAITALSQDCTDYHQYHCTYADYTYFYSQQSKSLLLPPGQKSEMNIIVYAGEEYYIALCAHQKLGNVQFRILEDSPKRTEIYDNAKDNYSPSISFANQRTRKLIIEITTPSGKPGDKNKYCAGVLVEFKKKS
ncbi:MAG: hypothetical protein JXB34_05215 [Bacteroidales bacterium]|nr:hypothetical protein [Bacteroidales bacterium]